jgi:peptidyl-prolyl cis-trans isomerase SurA
MVNQLKRTSFLLAAFALGGASAAAQSGALARPESTGRIIEEIVVRVNNEIITRSELERARQTLRREIEEQDCRGCPRDQVEAMFREREKDLVRDLIDQQLLVQRGKDAGLAVEADVVRRLDMIRQRNNFATMEDLERAVAASGTPFEDFKANIRNQLLTEEVIRREVGPKIRISREEVKKYYDEHQKDFHRPEQVFLREIFVSTEGKSEEELPALEKKANDLVERVKRGEDFGELARRFSDGSTAAQGGELGVFERGQLARELEDLVFKMNRGQMTEVIRTRTGFLVLRVEQRYEPGLQPLEKVEAEIQNRIYSERMGPELRAFLKQLRQESYVMLKAGYTDSSAVSSSPIEEVPFQSEEDKKKEKKEKKKKSGE